jgi:hypothetical protein
MAETGYEGDRIVAKNVLATDAAQVIADRERVDTLVEQNRRLRETLHVYHVFEADKWGMNGPKMEDCLACKNVDRGLRIGTALARPGNSGITCPACLIHNGSCVVQVYNTWYDRGDRGMALAQRKAPRDELGAVTPERRPDMATTSSTDLGDVVTDDAAALLRQYASKIAGKANASYRVPICFGLTEMVVTHWLTLSSDGVTVRVEIERSRVGSFDFQRRPVAQNRRDVAAFVPIARAWMEAAEIDDLDASLDRQEAILDALTAAVNHEN